MGNISCQLIATLVTWWVETTMISLNRVKLDAYNVLVTNVIGYVRVEGSHPESTYKNLLYAAYSIQTPCRSDIF